MSKKFRRARARQKNLGRRQQSSSNLATVRTSAIMQDTKELSAPEESPYATLFSRYQYVLPELKRIGIISGALFFTLIILSFVFR